MLYTKLDQSMHQQRFAARFLGNFQAAQGCQLNVEVAHFAGAFSNPVQHLQKFLLMVVSIRNDLFKQGLQTAVCRTEAMNAFRLQARAELQQGTIHLLEYKLATFGRYGHNETKPGSGRDSVLREPINA